MSQTGGVRETQTVLTVSLDWMAEQIPPPGVLKIDVEGAELNVFCGAAKLLKAMRPIIIFEASHAHWLEVSSMLLDLGYTLYDSNLPSGRRKPLTRPAFNTLAVPSCTAAKSE